MDKNSQSNFIELDRIFINRNKIYFFNVNFIQFENFKLPITTAQFNYLRSILLPGGDN